MHFPNIFVKGIVPVANEIEVVPIPGKVLDKSILNSLLLACLLIDNYWIWAKGDEKDIIIYPARK